MFNLGNTARGLLAGAITSEAGVLVAAISGATDWISFLCSSIVAGAMLSAALIDPGSQPPKPDPLVKP